MRHMLRFFPLTLMFICLALTGCGSSDSTSGATVNDQFALAGSGPGTVTGTSQDTKITFLTSKSATDPDGTLNSLTYSVAEDSPALAVTFTQLIPFKATDLSGNAKAGLPVTLDVYSQSGSSAVVINYLKDGVVEPSANTVTTDSAGMGIFNITVTVPIPATPGFNYTDGIVYKAKTNNPIPSTAYGGFIVSTTRNLAEAAAP